MEKERKTKSSSRGHVLVLPFPIQGHINPILQLSKRLVSKGLKVTLLTTSSTHHNIQKLKNPNLSIDIEPLFDGFEEGRTPEATHEYFAQFERIVSESLAKLIQSLNLHSSQNPPPNYIVYDSVLPWALTVGSRFDLIGAPFFTQSNAVNAINYHFQRGRFMAGEKKVLLPAMPMLSGNELPTFVYDKDSSPALLDLIMGQFCNLDEADCLLVNSFDGLEVEVLKWVETQWPVVKNIGPTVPSMLLDKRLQDDKDYGLSFFKPNVDDCFKWLESKQAGSVVYVSFGSLAVLGDEQMKEIALGLKQSGYFFLWVVRESETNKLPSNFSEEVSEKGLIVNWSPQLQVLAHKSVGCFVTHCGWNSTLEALSSGVPMVAIPQWSDQPTNAKFVAEVWKVGVRVKVSENGFVKKEEIIGCVKEIMEGEKGKEIKSNSEKWKELAKEAVSEGGSSDRNIEELVAKLVSS